MADLTNLALQKYLVSIVPAAAVVPDEPLADSLERVDNLASRAPDRVRLPFPCLSMQVLRTRFQILPEVHLLRPRSPLVLAASQFLDVPLLVGDAQLPAEQSLYLVLAGEGDFVQRMPEEAARWLQWMKNCTLLTGQYRQMGMLAAPLKAFF